MALYGDESGHFRSVLEGRDEVFVVAVVSGSKNACMRCPRRTVSRRNELDEAKWTDLTEVEKRRFVECVIDNQTSLTCGYTAFSRQPLLRMQYSYLFHDGDNFEYSRDVSAIAWCYSEIISKLTAGSDSRDSMTFDKFYHADQSDKIQEMVSQRTADAVSVGYQTSHSSKGIQAADCIAGAVSERERGGRDWLRDLDDTTVIDVTDSAGAHIQYELSRLIE